MTDAERQTKRLTEKLSGVSAKSFLHVSAFIYMSDKIWITLIFVFTLCEPLSLHVSIYVANAVGNSTDSLKGLVHPHPFPVTVTFRP